MSFAGRAQLVTSIIFGICSYWISIFCLPQFIVKEIDRICRSFLWGDKEEIKKAHAISWESVCHSKKHGGLGFKEGSKWCKAAIAKYLWAISFKQDSV